MTEPKLISRPMASGTVSLVSRISLARDLEDDARSRRGRGRDEDVHDRLADGLGEDRGLLVGHERDGPHAGAREFHHHHAAEGVLVAAAQGVDHLPDRVVQRAQAGHALKQAGEPLLQEFPEEALRKETEDSEDDGHDEGRGQHEQGMVVARLEIRHPFLVGEEERKDRLEDRLDGRGDQADQQGDDVEREAERQHEEHPRQEVVAETRAEGAFFR